LQDDVGDYFKDGTATAVARKWMPEVDLYETRDSICLFVDLPGVDDKDVTLEIQNNFVTIQGKRKISKRKENFLRVERRYGSFQRSFRLPTVVNLSKIGTDFKLGVLKVKIQKDCEPEPRSTKVKIKIEKK